MKAIRKGVFSVETTLAHDGSEYFLFVGEQESWLLRATVQQKGTMWRVDVYDRQADRIGYSEAPLSAAKEKAVRDAMHHHMLRR